MLVISRKRNQTTVIKAPDGQEIVITQLKIAGDKSRIGIEADRGFRILRGELDEHGENEKEVAA